MTKFTPTSSRGFVLLLTLLLIPVAAVAMAGVCRLSMERAMAAIAAQEDLQRHWGQRSCQVGLWAPARVALEKANETSLLPVVALRCEVSLGGQRFDVLFSDEQCKVNINTVYQQRGREAAIQTLRTLLRHDEGALTIALHPAPPEAPEAPEAPKPPKNSLLPSGTQARSSRGGPTRSPGAETTKTGTADQFIWPRPFGSFGQMFTDTTPAALLGGNLTQTPAYVPPAEDAGEHSKGGFPGWGDFRGKFGGSFDDPALPKAPINHLTAWGDGRVNFRRASGLVLTQTCRGILGPEKVRKMQDLRAQQPGIGLFALLNQLQLTALERGKLDLVLTDYSSCHSMWIIVDTGRRRWYRLAVADAAGPTAASARTYDW